MSGENAIVIELLKDGDEYVLTQIYGCPTSPLRQSSVAPEFNRIQIALTDSGKNLPTRTQPTAEDSKGDRMTRIQLSPGPSQFRPIPEAPSMVPQGLSTIPSVSPSVAKKADHHKERPAARISYLVSGYAWLLPLYRLNKEQRGNGTGMVEEKTVAGTTTGTQALSLSDIRRYPLVLPSCAGWFDPNIPTSN